MKKATITINFDEEKTAALKLYLNQKGTSVEKELEKSLETLYMKSVPANVREFIALRTGDGQGYVMPKGKKQKTDIAKESSLIRVAGDNKE